MKKVTVVLMIAVVVVVISSFTMAASLNYSDLANTHWAYDAISAMTEKGILSGYPDGTFAPEKAITRAEFSKILVTALNLKDSKDISFTDVSDNHWAKKYIGIVGNYLENYQIGKGKTFRPEEAAVREEVVVAIVNALGLQNEEVEDTILNKFTDKETILENAKKYVAIAAEKGIMNGNSNGTFNPKGFLTRAEVSQLVYNVMQKAEKILPSTKEYTVSVTANAGGEVEPYGNNKIKEGKKLEIEIEEKTGYEIKNVLIDGENIKKAELEYDETEKVYYYTFEKVKENHDFKVVFGKKGSTMSSSTQTVVQSENKRLENSFALLKYMPKNQNYMISPFSIKMAMMLAANGAEGNTQKEILEVFGVNNIEEYNQYAKELINKYNTNEYVKLNVANSIWLNSDVAINEITGNPIKFAKQYQNTIQNYFGGEAQEVKRAKIVNTVNKWISEKTNKKIENMLNDDAKKALSILVNAIYFKGDWENQFEKNATQKDIFTDRDGNKKETDFMHQKEKYRYYEDDNMQMIRLPYKGNKTAMYAVLAKNENEIDFEDAIDKMMYQDVIVTFPKFKVEYGAVSFKEILKELGIKTAFLEGVANFTPMFGENVAYIGDVLQKTFIEVDEEGTEAAAATAVIIMKTTSAINVEPPKEFKADRPFTYFIRDEETGEVLFMGEYAYVM